tara:strand:+ start:2067 stop:2828 length:762 start_codon:yes stop_codon:yes gene_type:complete
MDVGEMHYEFKLKLNKVDSLDYNNFLVPEIDWYLNEAQSIYIKTRYSGNNSRAAGFEASQKRTDDLRNLVVRDKIFAAIPTSSDPSVYEVLLPSTGIERYMFALRMTANGAKSGCEGKLNCIQTQHDDLNDTLKNPFYAPSFEWREVPIVYGTTGAGASDINKVFVYTDGSFSITSINIDYLRHPARIAYPSGFAGNQYLLPDNSGTLVTADQNCELSEHTHKEIVDLAVQIVAGDIDHPGFQSKMLKTSINE